MTTLTSMRRSVAIVLSIAFVTGLFSMATASPASAAPCNGSSSQSSVWGNCQGSSGKGIIYVDPDPDVQWEITRHLGVACVDERNNPSERVDMVGVVNGRTTYLYDHCIVQWALTLGLPSQEAVELAVPKPEISADFSGSFLTGAPVVFALAEPGVLTRDIPGFDASVTATPIKWVWDFGDGTTSNESSPTHVYRSKDINEEHVAKVTVTVTYAATLQQAAGAPNDLEDIEVTNEIERPIVEVWSALTEAR